MLRFQEKRVLAEQVKLVLQNVPAGFGGSWIAALLVSTALVEQAHILSWFALYTLVCVCGGGYLLVRRSQSGPDHDKWFLLGVTFLGGSLWGTLPWIAFDPGNIASVGLILGVVAGIVGAALAMMSPFLPCYLGFLTTAVFPLAVVLLRQHDAIFFTIGMLCLVYAAAMYYFARFSQRATFQAIDLQFQNTELLQKMKLESESAHAARDQAKAATEAKTKFLAAASHDLRQPVHALSLFIEALSRSNLTSLQREMVNSARLASLATSDMLNTLLDFSKIEGGILKPEARAFYLQPMLSQLERQLGHLADQKELIYRSRETQLAVHADPALTSQILHNLITNAVRYTQRGGVLIGCRRRGRNAIVEVWDTGIGIPRAQVGKIFQEFYQLDNPERARQKGLGLGLAIVHGLAKTMDVEISVDSKPGRGSVFRLSLPLATSAIIENVAPVREIAEFKGKHGLVIDDDAMALEGMRALLESWQCTVDTAETINQALFLAGAHHPDFLITDHRLREGQTSREAIFALRKKISPTLPVITITGDTAPERISEASAMDTVLLYKPVATGELNAAIVKLLKFALDNVLPGGVQASKQ